jgi:hypothetical protein
MPNRSLNWTARQRRSRAVRARRLLRSLVRPVLNGSIVRPYAPTALIPRRMAFL